MKGREGKGPPSADLLACFPSRAHLTLMAPKPICSPSRPSEPPTRHRRPRQTQHKHRMRNASKRGGGHASPLIWAKTKSTKSDISEPTSPKVTCAGQIKVRPKNNSCKSWQSVMEEIERLHNRNKKKKQAWAEALGFKKDVMNFLTCLRNIRFDFRCFGSFQNAEITSDDEDDEEEEEQETFRRNFQVEPKEEGDDHNESSRAFAKWFMILQENTQSAETEEARKGKVNRPYYNEEEEEEEEYDDGDDDDGPCAPPPPNALLLMRCRSAPAKSWLEEKEEEEKRQREDDHEEKLKEEQKMETERLVVMRCGTDFSKFSCDIAKETWVVGGIKDMLSRSRSSKR